MTRQRGRRETKQKSGSAKAPARHNRPQSGHGSDPPGLKSEANVTLPLPTRWGRWGKGMCRCERQLRNQPSYSSRHPDTAGDPEATDIFYLFRSFMQVE